MRMIRYLSLLLVLFCSIVAMGQNTGDFNPDSPGEPGVPVIPDPKPDPPTLYTLTLAYTEGGTKASGAGSYEAGTAVTVTAGAAAANHVFLGWVNEAGDTLNRERSFDYTMPAEGVTLTACYRFSPGSPGEPGEPNIPETTPPVTVTKYTLTLLAAEGGRVVGGAGKHRADTVVTVTAKVNENFVFLGWVNEAGDTLSRELSFDYTMPAADVTLKACYRFIPGSPGEPGEPVIPEKPEPIPTHVLTVSCTEGGTISLAGTSVGQYGTREVEENATVAVSVALATNFKFEGWYCADTLYSAAKDFTFTMAGEDISLEARYTYGPGSPGEPGVPETKKNEIYLMSIIGLPGETINFPLYLNNADTISGLSMIMEFPKGITPDFANALTAADMEGGSFAYKQLDATDDVLKDAEQYDPATHDYYRLTVTDADIAPTNIPLLIVPTAVNDTITKANYRVWLSQVTFTRSDGTEVGGSTRNGAINTAYEDPDSYAYLDNLISVGGDSWEVTQPHQVNTATPVSSKRDMKAVMTALGCSGVSFVTFKGGSAPGVVTDQLTAGSGYWFNRDGYACAATDEARVMSITFNSADNTLVLTQRPNVLNAGDVVTAKVYFTYRYKYYETVVTLNATESDEERMYTVDYIVQDTVYHSATSLAGQKIPTVANPARTGYTFDGWDGMPADSIMPANDLRLTAKWTANKYVITYMSDDAVYRRDTLAYGSAITAAAAPVKVGHAFSGWTPALPATMPANDITVTAVWNQVLFTVTYIVADTVYNSTTATVGQNVPAVANPARPGYTFSGWDGMPADGMMPANDLRLTAQWTINNYVITYMSDGAVYHRDTLSYGSAVTAAASPVKEGHTFGGWSPALPATMPANDITVTALWTVNNYVITYMSDGEVVHTEILPYGSPVLHFIPLLKEGHTFCGWSPALPETMPAQDVTVTAQWTVDNYIITYMSDDDIYNIRLLPYGSPLPDVGSPVKEGHTFAGWSPEVPETMPAQNVTFTAQWTVNNYQLTYIVDDEPLRVDEIPYGAEINPLTPEERRGCTFGGWKDLPPTMPARDVTVRGYNHVIDTDSVALDGHLTDVMLAELNNLKQVRVLNIADVTDKAVAIGGLVSLQKASLPKTLTSYEGTLTNCPNLMEIVAEGTTEIPANAFSGSGTNANMIVYAPAGTDAQYAGNVVIGGHADEVVLVDGNPVSISREFTAARISYTRNFVKTSYLYECAGWETIVLPFDVMEITNKGNILAPFYNGTAGVKNFWLAGLTSSGFGRASRIQANIPYIICMPNSEEYDDWYNISGDVTFSATNATVHRTADARVFSCNEFDLVPSYSTVEGGVTVYPLNDDEHDGHRAGSVFVSNLRDVRPFEAYARRSPSAPLRMMLSIGDMSPTGIMEVNAPGKAVGSEDYDLLGRPTTSSHKGIRITRDSKGRRVAVGRY